MSSDEWRVSDRTEERFLAMQAGRFAGAKREVLTQWIQQLSEVVQYALVFGVDGDRDGGNQREENRGSKDPRHYIGMTAGAGASARPTYLSAAP